MDAKLIKYAHKACKEHYDYGSDELAVRLVTDREPVLIDNELWVPTLVRVPMQCSGCMEKLGDRHDTEYTDDCPADGVVTIDDCLAPLP